MSHPLPITTSNEISERRSTVAVLPVGSFEQHGAHLPLTTDTLIASIIAREIADTYNLFLLPPITFGCSHEHAGFPGTVSISATTLYAVVNDIANSLAQSGIHRLILVNGHGGNYVLANVVQEATVTEPRLALFPGNADWQGARAAGHLGSNQHDDMHAGELETSILLHAMPEVVRPGYRTADHDAPQRPHLLTLGVGAYSPTGVIGRPSLATAAKGKIVVQHLVLAAEECVDQLRPEGPGVSSEA